MKFSSLISLLICLGLVVYSYGQQERILRYDTRIEVHKDRSIDVSESITFYVTGEKIKRGPTRSLPTSRYLLDHKVKMHYDILEVRKNGEIEPYMVRGDGGNQTLYIGDKDVLLQPGEYTYLIRYSVPNQVGSYEEYDEIYWNAIGNNVEFTIEEASCRIRVPDGAKIVQESAYVGSYGSQDKSYEVVNEINFIDYRITRPLAPGEGFTVGVGFEKGYITEPGLFQKFGTLILAILSILILAPYYIYTWWKYGQDPPTPASYPIYSSPDNLSAASINYIRKGGYEAKSFTASIIDLAIKGFLRIEEREKKGFFSKSKTYELVKLKDGDHTIPSEEKLLLDTLFMSGDRYHLDGEYDPVMEKTSNIHQANLSAQHRSFIKEGHNSRFLVIPVIAALILIGLCVYLFAKSPYAQGINLIALVILVPVMIIGIAIYGYLIKKPTTEKLDLRSRIKGFLMYLEMAEKDRLNLLNPPELTPSHFEEALPYAFALGVEHKWSDKFKNILEAAKYRPDWNNSSNPTLFIHSFGRDFSSSVSSASTQPQQSGGGGSGGGGFSGGGGGGGGVGGW
ncbi:MAG: DUF2207 domain-containing protein [Saprospiraceae bacterium]|nr:DUF2207 domain-containing protein [Saprospiraceae bacterium]